MNCFHEVFQLGLKKSVLGTKSLHIDDLQNSWQNINWSILIYIYNVANSMKIKLTLDNMLVMIGCM